MPAMRRLRRQTCRYSAPNYFTLGRRDPQTFGSSQPLNVPLAYPPTFLAQQRHKAAIPIARMFRGQFQHALSQLLLP
jgi:hypothetical protein